MCSIWTITKVPSKFMNGANPPLIEESIFVRCSPYESWPNKYYRRLQLCISKYYHCFSVTSSKL